MDNGFEQDESPRNGDTNKNKKGRKKSSSSFKPLSQKQTTYAMNIAQREKAMSARSNKVHIMNYDIMKYECIKSILKYLGRSCFLNSIFLIFNKISK